MAEEEKPQTGREHEVGTLAAPLLTLDLNREIEQLRSEGRWQSGHTAKTLAKYPDLRVVLIVMKAGGRLEKHQAEGRISVQTLDGKIRFNTAERSVELPAGQMLTLERGIPHDVEGVVDSAFLLTIAWPHASPFGSDGKMAKTFKRGDHVAMEFGSRPSQRHCHKESRFRRAIQGLHPPRHQRRAPVFHQER